MAKRPFPLCDEVLWLYYYLSNYILPAPCLGASPHCQSIDSQNHFCPLGHLDRTFSLWNVPSKLSYRGPNFYDPEIVLWYVL